MVLCSERSSFSPLKRRLWLLPQPAMREEEGAAKIRRGHRGVAVIHSRCAVLLCLSMLLCAHNAGSDTVPNKRGVQSTSSSPGKIVIKRMSERMLYAGAATIGPPQQLPTVVEDTARQLSGHISEPEKSRVERELKSRAAHNHHYRRHRTDHHISRRHSHRHDGAVADWSAGTHTEAKSRHPYVAKRKRRKNKRRRRGHHSRGRTHRRQGSEVKDEGKDDGDEDEDEDEEEEEGVRFKGSVEWLNEEEEEGRWIPGSTVSQESVYQKDCSQGSQTAC